MADAVRYYMDQHFPGPVTAGLRRRGIDVLTAQEVDRCELPDRDWRADPQDGMRPLRHVRAVWEPAA